MQPILGMGGLRVIHGAMTVGDIVAFQSLMSSFSQPARGLPTLPTKYICSAGMWPVWTT